MRLSILIPSVPSRREKAAKLFDKLSAQAGNEDVEILMLLDNKKRSIGLKRQALLDVARGDYVAFVDDDDFVAPTYVEAILEATLLDLDVIVFDSYCSIDDGPTVLVRHSLTFPNEQYNFAGFRRAAWHIHAWRADLARQSRFPDQSGTEDWAWAEPLNKLAQTQVKLDVPLYHYRFNSETTEAPK
jgi:glycosyltransferase involved in cell wall biosynthesis